MTTTLPRYFISTYTKVIITSYPSLNSILFSRTSSIKDQLRQDSSTDQDDLTSLKLLTNDRFNDAINGPFSSYLKSFMTAFSVLAHLKQQLIEHNDDVFKQAASADDDDYKINKAVIKKVSNNECEKIGEELSKLMNEVDTTWSDYVNEQAKLLIEKLRSFEIEFTDSDLQDFNNLYTISEIIGRLDDMNIVATLDSSTEHYHFKEYFKLKCKLAIYSHMGRQHQSINEKTLNKMLVNIEPCLNDIASKEQQILSSVQEKIENILKPIAFAKINSL